MRYVSAKEGAKNPLFNLVGELSVDMTQQEKMDSLLMKNLETITQPETIWTR